MRRNNRRMVSEARVNRIIAEEMMNEGLGNYLSNLWSGAKAVGNGLWNGAKSIVGVDTDETKQANANAQRQQSQQTNQQAVMAQQEQNMVAAYKQTLDGLGTQIYQMETQLKNL